MTSTNTSARAEPAQTAAHRTVAARGPRHHLLGAGPHRHWVRRPVGLVKSSLQVAALEWPERGPCPRGRLTTVQSDPQAVAVPGVVLRRDTSKAAKLLVLRHENAVLRRQIASPVRYEPEDRFLLTTLSSLIPVATGLRSSRSRSARCWPGRSRAATTSKGADSSVRASSPTPSTNTATRPDLQRRLSEPHRVARTTRCCPPRSARRNSPIPPICWGPHC